MPKYLRAAALVREMIGSGELRPGAAAPSSPALARQTGFSELTCRRALRTLVVDGTLVPGVSDRARPRVPAGTGGEADRIAAAAVLSGALARLRGARDLTQPQLAEITGASRTAVGHAETGRVWQAGGFWERADAALGADGELLRLHAAYAAAALTGPLPRPAERRPDGDAMTVTVPAHVEQVQVTWGDGTTTTVSRPSWPGEKAG